jgi:LacI family transcriptional regulator
MSVNLKELAKKLNLSISTVSRALRDSPEISETTKKIVQKKAQELNYHANPFASNLRNQKSNTIAVIIPAIANNFFSSAISGAESFAQEKGYHVLIYQTHEELVKEVSILKHLQNGRVDGIMISLTRETFDTSHLKDLMNRNIPLVFFDRVAENLQAPKVTTDDFESAYKGTEHLIKNGSKKIAFIGISEVLAININRLAGCLAAMQKYKINIDKSLLITCDEDKIKNKQKIKKLLSKPNRPDAIFACVEEIAIAVYEVCEENKISIPEEMKLISFSNLNTAGILKSSLTSITQPAYEIGREAASELFKLMDKKDFVYVNNHIVLKSTLNIRSSTKSS